VNTNDLRENICNVIPFVTNIINRFLTYSAHLAHCQMKERLKSLEIMHNVDLYKFIYHHCHLYCLLTLSIARVSNSLSSSLLRHFISTSGAELRSLSTGALDVKQFLYRKNSCLITGCFSNIDISFLLSSRYSRCGCGLVWEGVVAKQKKLNEESLIMLDIAVTDTLYACLATAKQYAVSQRRT